MENLRGWHIYLLSNWLTGRHLTLFESITLWKHHIWLRKNRKIDKKEKSFEGQFEHVRSKTSDDAPMQNKRKKKNPHSMATQKHLQEVSHLEVTDRWLQAQMTLITAFFKLLNAQTETQRYSCCHSISLLTTNNVISCELEAVLII